jgi:hypothetical protein
MQAAQSDLLSEAIALQQCEANSGYASDECASKRASYNLSLIFHNLVDEAVDGVENYADKSLTLLSYWR